MLTQTQFFGVEHQDDERHHEGSCEVGTLGTHQGYQTEDAGHTGEDHGADAAGGHAFKADQVNAGVEVGQHGQQHRICGQHVEEIGSVSGLGSESGQANHQGSHLQGAQDQTLLGYAVLVHFTVDFREVAIVGGTLARLAYQHHPGTERGEAGQGGEGRDERCRPATEDGGRGHGKRGAGGSHFTCWEHAADHLGREDVDNTRDTGTQHGGERYGALGILHHAGRDGGRFNTDERPEADQHGADDRMQVAATGGVPVLAVNRGIKVAPAHQSGTHHRQQDQYQTQSTESAHPATAKQVDEGEDPDSGDGGCSGRDRAVENGEEDGEVGDAGNGDGQVTDPVGVVVEHTGLETEYRRNFTGVGNGATLLRVLGSEAGENEGEAHGAYQTDSPAEYRNGTYVGQCRRQQCDTAPHHVAGHYTCTGDKADLLARI